MNQQTPVYTANAECQDCFKCVRHCPVKAIKVEEGHASVMPELCVACGRCVEVCPAHAKKIRNDLSAVKELLRAPDPVYVSLAPSWVSEFKGLPAGKMIAALKSLGFKGVSETALGAQIVSADVAKKLRSLKSGVMISSACPVVVDMIRKYLPDFAGSISPVLSPALAHARLLKEKYGQNAKIVFIGPCIAKMNEADRHPELIDAALLYPRLRDWFRDANLDLWTIKETEQDHFDFAAAEEGALYPIEGGMNDTIKLCGGCDHIHFATVSGIPALRQTLDGLSPEEIREPVFIETLACIGGCVHGPGTQHGSPGLLERLRIIRSAEPQRDPAPRPVLKIDEDYQRAAVGTKDVSLQEIRQALWSVGKTRPEDELNCGGCGYDTCHNFALALIAGKAEPNMCVSWLRKLAQKKSNAILRCVPAAVVIVDSKLRLIECNRRFAELAGPEALEVFDEVPGMSGAVLDKLVPFPELFEQVLRSGIELKRDMIRMGKKLLSLDIFNIDPGQAIGAMFFDVTNTEFRREQIAERAKEVINKNLATVQDIACRLGEHMAETEILLRSIAEDYADQKEADTFESR
ncbi:MAG: [Fe-Fe] hydrogenase large subunit C-terminal domain-containing protein [Planctomycetia bacterium]|nr:[Fe-Fe] hydrogenase large subunit C-terminal domain-containing protein [Planctomycetia bacterium]